MHKGIDRDASSASRQQHKDSGSFAGRRHCNRLTCARRVEIAQDEVTMPRSVDLTWWAAKWEQTQAIRRRQSVKLTATAPLLPPTPSTPQATLAVLTSPILP